MLNENFDILQQNVTENQLPDRFSNAIGDTPQVIVTIRRMVVNWQWHTAIETVVPHELNKGDKVRIFPNVADTDSAETANLFNNEFTVTKINGSKEFSIGVAFKSGMRLGGTWQLASSLPNCGEGFMYDPTTHSCIPKPIDTPEPSASWVWWVVGGISVVAIGIIAVKMIKRKQVTNG
jgi:hypothetical protein